MKKMVIRLTFLIICMLLLGDGLLFERHQVKALDSDQAKRVGGPSFVQGATVDSYMLLDGQVFDVYSLSKATANVKDCKT